MVINRHVHPQRGAVKRRKGRPVALPKPRELLQAVGRRSEVAGPHIQCNGADLPPAAVQHQELFLLPTLAP